jgi:hypothetical protein
LADTVNHAKLLHVLQRGSLAQLAGAFAIIAPGLSHTKRVVSSCTIGKCRHRTKLELLQSKPGIVHTSAREMVPREKVGLLLMSYGHKLISLTIRIRSGSSNF